MGTADYMAPETLTGADVSILMDFWSLGVLAIEFLTGTLPFNDESPEQIFKNIINKKIVLPQIGTEDGEVTAEAQDFIDKLL